MRISPRRWHNHVVEAPAVAPDVGLTEDDVLHWLALTLVSGLGHRSAVRLVERFQTPQAVFRASRSELEASGLAGAAAQTIVSGCTFEEAASQADKMKAEQVCLVPLNHPHYPPRLREIYDPPLALFVRGRVQLLQSLMLGVVGTRRPTPYGMAVTERLSADLAQAGLTIVSGMARGIDTASHRAALAAGGDTIAVFGSGIDVLYPVENRRLRDQIAEQGVLVSEYPMSTPALPQNFPVRNRLISGMSCGILVVEGAQYSGSAITAKLAMEQNREVFAVPGNITSRMSWGPNLLIKQGAKLVQEWNDVIVELPVADRCRLMARLRDDSAIPAAPSQQLPLSMGSNAPVAEEVLRHLHADQTALLDDLLEKIDRFSPSEIIAALFELEIAGLVRQLPGKNFVKVW